MYLYIYVYLYGFSSTTLLYVYAYTSYHRPRAFNFLFVDGKGSEQLWKLSMQCICFKKRCHTLKPFS